MKKTLALALSLSLVSVLALPSQVLGNALKPTSVTVVSTSTNDTPTNEATVRVTWPAVATAVAYSVNGSATGQANGQSSIYVCNSGTCTATVAGLAGGVNYSFVVTAFGAGVSEATSDPVNFTARSIPSGPAPLAPILAAGAVTLSWAAPTNTGGLALTGYEIVESAGAVPRVVLSNANASTYVFEGLSGGVRYSFVIRSRNSLGLSEPVAFATLSASGAPNAPTGVSTTRAGSTVTVTWTAPGDNGAPITGYKIFLVNSETGQDVGQFTPALASGTALANLASGAYSVQVVATNSSGDGPRSIASPAFTIGSGIASNTPIISPSSLSSLGIGESVFVSANSPSGRTVSLSVSSSPAGACTLVSGVLRAVSNGTCTLNASVSGTAIFAEGSVSRQIVIRLAQTISFEPISTQSMPGPFTLLATSSANLPVQFTASGSCSVTGTQLTFIAAGGCSVTASQAGNNVFSSAQPITRSFVISAGLGGAMGFGPPSLAPPAEVITPPRASTIFSSRKAGPARVLVLTKPVTRVSLRAGQSVRVRLTGLPQGTRVSSVLTTKEGFSYFLSAAVVRANGSYRTPAVKPRKSGVYRIITTIGTETKTLRVRVR